MEPLWGPIAQTENPTNLIRDIHGAEQLPAQQQRQLQSLIAEYSSTFTDVPPEAKLPPYTMDTGNAPPVCRKPYRPPFHHKEKLDQQIQELLHNGIIRPSTSPWLSQVMVVPKKTGDVRLFVDFHGVNQVTQKDNYPLPYIDELIHSVSQATYLTSLDLTQGYHQVPLDPSSIPKTAFVVHSGKYEYTHLSFGLSGVPVHFQRAMDTAFAGLKVKAYIILMIF